MQKILNWLKNITGGDTYIKPQKFVELKRENSTVKFIHPGHPLYDNIVADEENKISLLAPNEAAYNENSLIHNFVAIVLYNDANYLVINSFKHFKEHSLGGLLQFDENIYNVIPFSENDEEYKTADDYIFKETYEYDHPVETYAFTAEYDNKTSKIALEHGKKPLTIRQIDEKRPVFTDKLSQKQIEMIDYTVIPAINAYTDFQEKRKSSKAS